MNPIRGGSKALCRSVLPPNLQGCSDLISHAVQLLDNAGLSPRRDAPAIIDESDTRRLKSSMPKRSSSQRPARAVKTAKSQPKADRPFAPGYGIVGVENGKGLLPWADRKSVV